MPVTATRKRIESVELVDRDGDRLEAKLGDDVIVLKALDHRTDRCVLVNANADEVRELAAALSELADELDDDS